MPPCHHVSSTARQVLRGCGSHPQGRDLRREPHGPDSVGRECRVLPPTPSCVGVWGAVSCAEPPCGWARPAPLQVVGCSSLPLPFLLGQTWAEWLRPRHMHRRPSGQGTGAGSLKAWAPTRHPPIYPVGQRRAVPKHEGGQCPAPLTGRDSRADWDSRMCVESRSSKHTHTDGNAIQSGPAPDCAKMNIDPSRARTCMASHCVHCVSHTHNQARASRSNYRRLRPVPMAIGAPPAWAKALAPWGKVAVEGRQKKPFRRGHGLLSVTWGWPERPRSWDRPRMTPFVHVLQRVEQTPNDPGEVKVAPRSARMPSFGQTSTNSGESWRQGGQPWPDFGADTPPKLGQAWSNLSKFRPTFGQHGSKVGRTAAARARVGRLSGKFGPRQDRWRQLPGRMERQLFGNFGVPLVLCHSWPLQSRHHHDPGWEKLIHPQPRSGGGGPGPTPSPRG